MLKEDGKGIKITGITKIRTVMEVKEDKEGNTAPAYSMAFTVDLSGEEAKYIDKQANLHTKWVLELSPQAYNLPLKGG